ncbi:MAG: roadblock/LC7 domain-containing protein [Nitriliruptorales bacterium]|nr:roadblock/LC7 domain-containing protein [Nitriliruptorales bacterium]
MPESKAQRLAQALDDFIKSSPDVEAAAVVSFDGLPMASALPETMEEDRVGAMAAALLSLGEQAAIGLGRGQLNQVFVEGEHGFVFLMSARDQAVLAAVARRTAKIGFMLFEMRRAADRIGEVLIEGRGEEDPYAGVADAGQAEPSQEDADAEEAQAASWQ